MLDVRLHRDDLAVDGQHVGDGADRPASPAASTSAAAGSCGRRRSRRWRPRGVVQPALSDSVFSPSARWPSRQRADEEIGVVAAGALGLRGDPVRPRPQQVGAQHQVLAAQEVAERQLAVWRGRGAQSRYDRSVADDAVRVIGRPREQHPALLERLAGGGADQRLGQIGSMPNRCAHQCGPGPAHAPAMSALRSRSSTPPPGNTIVPAAKSILRVPTHQEHGQPGCGPSAVSRMQHHGRGGPGNQRLIVRCGHERLRWAARVRTRRAK